MLEPPDGPTAEALARSLHAIDTLIVEAPADSEMLAELRKMRAGISAQVVAARLDRAR
jgi:hypothetical protein